MKVMARLNVVLASAAALCVGVGGYARTHIAEAPVDSTIGAKLASRIPCDGATNPEDQVNLVTTFSPGGWEREFRISTFEDKYCKRGDLGWACVQPGHTLWKPDWSADSSVPTATAAFGLSSCLEQGSKDAPQIVLTGWYKETNPDPKEAKKEIWKQVEIKKAASRWETYEFADPNGGTARVEIDRR
jgi:hypothetical protein